MPDIKTALEKALAQTANAWAEDDKTHQQIQPQQEKAMTLTVQQHTDRVNTNISRTTFEFIRDNPGLTNQEVADRLSVQGFKKTTISSLAYQMLRVRLIVADEAGRLTAVVREYVPIQTNLHRKRKAKPAAKPVQYVAPTPRKHVEIVSTRTGEVLNPRPVAEPTPATKGWSPNDVIDTLTVHQAIALFKALRSVLVG
jgi:DNA-binding transcriptional regulator YiaG